MVQLMLQPVFLDISPHTGSSNAPGESTITGDELYQMWSIAKKAKSAIAHGYRLENLAWRLWYTSTLRARCGKAANGCSNGGNLAADVQGPTANGSNPETASSDSDQNSYFVRETSNSTFVLPSDRSLLAAAYASILVEIQDTSIRQRPHFISNKTSSSGSRAIPRAATTTVLSSGLLVPQNGVSPPVGLRALSPTNFGGRHGSGGNTIGHTAAAAIATAPIALSAAQQSTSGGNRKKKNIDKFLRKYQTRLEDISELHGEDESSDGTTGEERALPDDESSQGEFRSAIKNSHEDDISDEHQSNEHFASNISSSSLRVEKQSPENVGKASGQSLLSRLLRGSGREQSSLPDVGAAATRSNAPPVPVAAVPEPLHRLPSFLLQASLGSASGSGSGNSLLINDQLELMASNRYERFVPAMQRSPSISSNATSPPVKSPLSGNNRAVARQASNLDSSDSLDQEAFRADTSDVDMPVVIW